MYTTPKEVAAKLAVSIFTVYELLDKGELEGLKVGRCRRVLVASLDRFIARNTTPEKQQGQAEEPPPVAAKPAAKPTRRRRGASGFRFLPVEP